MVVARILVAACCACCALPAPAQSYPSKSIRLISPFPAGGGTDATGRLIAQALAEQLGEQVIVDNRGGAGGRIAMEMAARSAPDGYTLILANVGPFAIVPASGIRLSFDPVKDFVPVSMMATSDYILTVQPSFPARTIPELLALAKAKPGVLTYASSGNISGPHLGGELLNLLGNVSILHIPYKGNAPAAIAVLSGESTMMFGRGSVVPHIEAGRLRGIATTGATRSTPPLPAIAETLPGFEITQWYGILAPAGTPRPIVDRLNKEIRTAMAKPRVAQSYVALGTEPATGTPEEFGALLKVETARYVKLLRAAKISAQ
jgi:tripartite-type tricarboxylate transporter receptor subunit TctC